MDISPSGKGEFAQFSLDIKSVIDELRTILSVTNVFIKEEQDRAASKGVSGVL